MSYGLMDTLSDGLMDYSTHPASATTVPASCHSQDRFLSSAIARNHSTRFWVNLPASEAQPAPSGTDMPLNYLDGQNKFHIPVDAERGEWARLRLASGVSIIK
jgi:hypothetical protein